MIIEPLFLSRLRRLPSEPGREVTELSESEIALVNAKHDLKNTRKDLSADQKFLVDMKEKCSASDKECAASLLHLEAGRYSWKSQKIKFPQLHATPRRGPTEKVSVREQTHSALVRVLWKNASGHL